MSPPIQASSLTLTLQESSNCTYSILDGLVLLKDQGGSHLSCIAGNELPGHLIKYRATSVTTWATEKFKSHHVVGGLGYVSKNRKIPAPWIYVVMEKTNNK